jgi:hypothetical protein
MTATLTHTHAQVDGFRLGRDDALVARAPLYTYPADIDLYARDEFVAAYVDGYESVSNPV